MSRTRPAGSPARQEGAARPEASSRPVPFDRLRWTVWGVAAALSTAVVFREGHAQFAVVPGTEIPSLLAGLFVMPAGGLLGFASATILNRRRSTIPTDIDAPAPPADASGPTGTD